MAIEDVLRNFDREVGKIEKRSQKVVYEVAADLLNESNKLTPFEFGNLRKSGKVKFIQRGRRPIARVSYGDGRVGYAAAVHEVNKNYKEPGTGWKYLERPLKEHADKYIKYMRRRIGEVL